MKYYASNGFSWAIINADSEEEARLEAEINVGMYVNEFREATAEEIAEYQLDYPECRVCGCTDEFGCPGGCYWVEPDLCSRCVGKRDVSEEIT